MGQKGLVLLSVVLLLMIGTFYSNCAGYTAKEIEQGLKDSSSGSPGDPTPTPGSSPGPSGTPDPNLTGGLPAPNHPMDIGYYFQDSKYGQFIGETNCYTNLIYFEANDGYMTGSGEPYSVWMPALEAGFQRAVAANLKVLLALDIIETNPELVPQIIQRLKPYWNSVKYINLGDEPGWDKDETESMIQAIRSAITSNGLAEKPYGIVVTNTQLSETGIQAPSLNWVGVEAYVNPPGSPDTAVNDQTLRNTLNEAANAIPANKKIMLIPMGYARNFAWKDINTLTALQHTAYLWGYNNPRVLGLEIFSYGRPSGTREYPSVKKKHIQIGNAIFKKSCPLN